MKKFLIGLIKVIWVIIRFCLGIIGSIFFSISGAQIFGYMFGFYTKTVYKGPMYIPFNRLYWLGFDLRQEWKASK